MKNLIVGLIFLIALCIFLLPLYWSITRNPWDLFLILISWIPAMIIAYIGVIVHESK